VLVELFTGWQRLGEMPVQVARYRLASGIEKEALWRAGVLNPNSDIGGTR
jgi:hypothetical protein